MRSGVLTLLEKRLKRDGMMDLTQGGAHV